MYLTRRAIAELLTALGGLAEGTELIADHIYPRQVLDRAGRRLVDALARVAGTGEPWRTQLAPDELTDLLRRTRFGAIRQLRQRELVDRRCGSAVTACA
jgi:O-methyltransferase involved in polyketide biosynthesis